jgi:hypothetical protein
MNPSLLISAAQFRNDQLHSNIPPASRKTIAHPAFKKSLIE